MSCFPQLGSYDCNAEYVLLLTLSSSESPGQWSLWGALQGDRGEDLNVCSVPLFYGS